MSNNNLKKLANKILYFAVIIIACYAIYVVLDILVMYGYLYLVMLLSFICLLVFVSYFGFSFYKKLSTTAKHAVRMAIFICLMLIVVFMPFTIPVLSNFTVVFFTKLSTVDLPVAATNGEWAQNAITQEHPRLFNTTQEIINETNNIVRGEIINISRGRLALQHGLRDNSLYSYYRFEIAEVYKGNMGISDIIYFIQANRVSRRRTFYTNYISINLITEHLIVGDELILFLDRPLIFRDANTFMFQRIQGIYRYTPKELRSNNDNWIFESVNPHNNLVLTQNDLEQISTN